MDRPVKRRKLSGEAQSLDTDVISDDAQSSPDPMPVDDELVNVTIFPTSAQNIASQLIGELKARTPRSRRGIQLLPRSDTTITASVVRIHVKNGNTTIKTTEIQAPTSTTVLSLDIGPITVPPITAVSLATSTGSLVTSSPITSGSAISSGFVPSANATISSTTSGRTVTITTTSTLEVLLGNFTTTTQSSLPTVKTLPITTSRAPVVRTTKSAEQIITITDSPATIYTADYTTITGYEHTDEATYTVAASTGYTPGTVQPGSTSRVAPSATTSTTESGNGYSGPPPLTPQQQQVVGGVVGGVAGLAIVLLIFFAFMRFYRRPPGSLSKFSGGMHRHLQAEPGSVIASTSGSSSHLPFAGVLAGGFKRFQHQNSRTLTAPLASSTIESERGFHRIAGRKLPPVLNAGGDGFGGNYGVFEEEKLAGAMSPNKAESNERRLAGSSFYRDRGNFYTHRDSGSVPTTPTFQKSQIYSDYQHDTPDYHNSVAVSARDFAGSSYQDNHSQLSLLASNRIDRSDAIMMMRPSPARTPVTQSPAASSIRLSTAANRHSVNLTLDDDGAPPLPTFHLNPKQALDSSKHNGLGVSVPLPPHQFRERDSIGRSLASHDESRYSNISRSSMRSIPRFTEDL